MKLFFKNNTYKLEISIIDKKGDFVTGLTITYEIRRSADDVLIDSGTMSAEGNVYTASVSFSATGQYRVLYTTPAKYENDSEIIVVEDYDNMKADISNLETMTTKILGLSQENYRIFNPVYDVNHNLTSATIKIYPTATDCNNDTNEIAEYRMTATFIDNKCTEYKVIKV